MRHDLPSVAGTLGAQVGLGFLTCERNVNTRLCSLDVSTHKLHRQAHSCSSPALCILSAQHPNMKHQSLRPLPAEQVLGTQQANTAMTRTHASDSVELLHTMQPARQAGACSTPNTYLMATLNAASGTVLQLFTLQGTETVSVHHRVHVTCDTGGPACASDTQLGAAKCAA